MIKILDCKNSNYLSKLKLILDKRRVGSKINTDIAVKIVNDIKKNKKVFTQGHFLRPQDVAMLSALGLNKVKVTRKVKVGLLSNGNELINPGKKKEDNKIYDSNRYSLFSLLNTNSIKVLDKGIVKDDYHKIKSQISDLKNNCDLIIISGGASSAVLVLACMAGASAGVAGFCSVSVCASGVEFKLLSGLKR